MLDIEVWGGNDEVGLELDNVNRRVREARKGRIVPVSDGDGDNASEWIGV